MSIASSAKLLAVFALACSLKLTARGGGGLETIEPLASDDDGGKDDLGLGPPRGASAPAPAPVSGVSFAPPIGASLEEAAWPQGPAL